MKVWTAQNLIISGTVCARYLLSRTGSHYRIMVARLGKEELECVGKVPVSSATTPQLRGYCEQALINEVRPYYVATSNP